MISFSTVFFVTAIIFFVALTYLIVICIKTKMAKEKISSKIISGLVSAISFLSIALTPVPSPTIYPLEDNVKVYEGIVEITINPNDSSPFIHTYYSLDGSDQNTGNVYEDSFVITSSTTVFARNKFLWRWSEPTKSAYRFESMQNITVNHLDYDLNDRLISLNELTEIFAYLVVGGIFLKLAIDGLKNIMKI